MSNITKINKKEFYASLLQEANNIIKDESDRTANLANIAALLFHELEKVNWVGFYLLNAEKGELVLGPFQGKPAVSRIRVRQGVCGTSVKDKKPILVDNVCEFKGHITCDPDSRSECVIPIYESQEGKQKIVGVLDIDSPISNRFTNYDLLGLSGITSLIEDIFSN